MPKLKALLFSVLSAGIILELFFLISPKFQSPINIKTFVTESFNECGNKDNWRDCYGRKMTEITKKHDFALTLKVISELQKQDEKVNDCHILAHYSAISAVEKDPGKWQNILKLVELSDCNYGYIHGSLEGLSRVDPNFLINARTIPKICAQIADIKGSKGADQGCAHIMGHLTLASFCDKNLNTSLEKAVKVCSSVTNSLQHECFAGIFMESFTRDNLSVHCETPKASWDEELVHNQEVICKSFNGEASISCWQEISHLYNSLFPDDPASVYKACTKAEAPEKISACYLHAVATLIRGPEEKKYLKSICQPVANNSQAHHACISYALGSILTASINSLPRALLFCQSHDEDSQEPCFDGIMRSIKNKTTGPDRIKACKELPTKYQEHCRN